VARQVLCTSERFYELTHSDESRPPLDHDDPTATANAHRHAAGTVACAAFGEAGLLERVALGCERRREFASIPFRYKPGLIL
jgi:hypothetical protein